MKGLALLKDGAVDASAVNKTRLFSKANLCVDEPRAKG
jgi:hypothetical protein